MGDVHGEGEGVGDGEGDRVGDGEVTNCLVKLGIAKTGAVHIIPLSSSNAC